MIKQVIDHLGIDFSNFNISAKSAADDKEITKRMRKFDESLYLLKNE
jgi:coenzyme F420-reducing hydrogenase delta subunit